MSVRAAILVYSVFAAIALIGWCVGSSFEDRRLDQCSQDLNRQIQTDRGPDQYHPGAPGRACMPGRPKLRRRPPQRRAGDDGGCRDCRRESRCILSSLRAKRSNPCSRKERMDCFASLAMTISKAPCAQAATAAFAPARARGPTPAPAWWWLPGRTAGGSGCGRDCSPRG